MGEYDRKQQKQESTAIAYNGGGSKQLKGIVDNRINSICNNVIQCDRYITKGNIYPHIHVGDNFVTFSHNANQHAQLEEGALVYIARVNALIGQIINETIVFRDEDNRGRVLNYLRGMRRTYNQRHPDQRQ